MTEEASPPPGWQRHAKLALPAIGLLFAAWVIRYTIFLDFGAYVSELQAQSSAEMMAGMSEAIGEIADGDLEAFEDATSRVRDRLGDLPEHEEMSETGRQEVANAFAEVGLLDPAHQVLRLTMLAGAEAPDAAARCRTQIRWLGEQHGTHAAIVLWINAGRCEELVRGRARELRPAAEAERRRLTDAQARAFDEAALTHGAMLLGAILDLQQMLSERRVAAEHMRLAQALADDPPNERGMIALSDRLRELEDPDLENDLLAGDCAMRAEPLHNRYAEVRLSCYGGDEHEPEDTLLWVDLEEGRVLEERPPVPSAAPEIEPDPETAAAIDALASRLRAAASGGELPDEAAAAPMLADAMERTGCIITYLPLGYYEEADLSVICDAGRFTRRVLASP